MALEERLETIELKVAIIQAYLDEKASRDFSLFATPAVDWETSLEKVRQIRKEEVEARKAEKDNLECMTNSELAERLDRLTPEFDEHVNMPHAEHGGCYMEADTMDGPRNRAAIRAEQERRERANDQNSS